MVHTYPCNYAHTHENIKTSYEVNYKKMMAIKTRRRMQEAYNYMSEFNCGLDLLYERRI